MQLQSAADATRPRAGEPTPTPQREAARTRAAYTPQLGVGDFGRSARRGARADTLTPNPSPPLHNSPSAPSTHPLFDSRR